MPKCFNKFSKNCHHHFEVEILRIFGIFHTCLCYFLPADTTEKKYVELKKLHSAILLQYSEFWPFGAKFCNLTLLILAIWRWNA